MFEMKARLQIAAAVVLMFPCFSFANELLVEVSKGDEQRIAARNKFFIEEQLYFAKNHRIVRVNSGLLTSGTPVIRLTLFALEIDVERQAFEFLGDETGFIWRGIYSDRAFTLEEYTNSNAKRSEEASKLLYEQIFGVEIAGSLYSIDRRNDQAVEETGMFRDPETGHFKRQSELLRSSPKQKSRDLVFSSQFTIKPVLKRENLRPSDGPFVGEFHLRPLPRDPEYALLYEVDEQKIFPGIDEYDVVTLETREKIEMYNRHVESVRRKKLEEEASNLEGAK
ncbi:MAG: hypothetical protein AAGI27_04370 [Pseudomonadota bacterium]